MDKKLLTIIVGGVISSLIIGSIKQKRIEQEVNGDRECLKKVDDVIKNSILEFEQENKA